MSILNYFSVILQTKYPDLNTPITITQNGNIVTMIIETEDGTKEVIEKTLDTYYKVITNNLPVTELLNNDYEILRLKNKLDISQLEVNQTKELLSFQKSNLDNRIKSLEDSNNMLQGLIGTQMQNHNIISLKQQNSIDKLIDSYSANNELQNKFSYIIEKIEESNHNNLKKKNIKKSKIL